MKKLTPELVARLTRQGEKSSAELQVLQQAAHVALDSDSCPRQTTDMGAMGLEERETSSRSQGSSNSAAPQQAENTVSDLTTKQAPSNQAAMPKPLASSSDSNNNNSKPYKSMITEMEAAVRNLLALETEPSFYDHTFSEYREPEVYTTATTNTIF